MSETAAPPKPTAEAKPQRTFTKNGKSLSLRAAAGWVGDKVGISLNNKTDVTSPEALITPPPTNSAAPIEAISPQPVVGPEIAFKDEKGTAILAGQHEDVLTKAVDDNPEGYGPDMPPAIVGSFVKPPEAPVAQPKDAAKTEPPPAARTENPSPVAVKEDVVQPAGTPIEDKNLTDIPQVEASEPEVKATAAATTSPIPPSTADRAPEPTVIPKKEPQIVSVPSVEAPHVEAQVAAPVIVPVAEESKPEEAEPEVNVPVEATTGLLTGAALEEAARAEIAKMEASGSAISSTLSPELRNKVMEMMLSDEPGKPNLAEQLHSGSSHAQPMEDVAPPPPPSRDIFSNVLDNVTDVKAQKLGKIGAGIAAAGILGEALVGASIPDSHMEPDRAHVQFIEKPPSQTIDIKLAPKSQAYEGPQNVEQQPSTQDVTVKPGDSLTSLLIQVNGVDHYMSEDGSVDLGKLYPDMVKMALGNVDALEASDPGVVDLIQKWVEVTSDGDERVQAVQAALEKRTQDRIKKGELPATAQSQFVGIQEGQTLHVPLASVTK